MVNNIYAFYTYSDKLAAGGQPSAENLTALKEAGFEVIINISPSSAKNALHNESGIVENLKMDYIHFPVDCSNLQPHQYMTFKGIMNGVEGKKIFVHCGGNIKSSNLIHMYQVLDKKMDESESLQTLLKIQNPEAKWYDYFKKMGMQGIAIQ